MNVRCLLQSSGFIGANKILYAFGCDCLPIGKAYGIDIWALDTNIILVISLVDHKVQFRHLVHVLPERDESDLGSSLVHFLGILCWLGHRPAYLHVVFDLGAKDLEAVGIDAHAIGEHGEIVGSGMPLEDNWFHRVGDLLLESGVCVGVLNKEPECSRGVIADKRLGGIADLGKYLFTSSRIGYLGLIFAFEEARLFCLGIFIDNEHFEPLVGISHFHEFFGD